jgi:hypothetical protein
MTSIVPELIWIRVGVIAPARPRQPLGSARRCVVRRGSNRAATASRWAGLTQCGVTGEMFDLMSRPPGSNRLRGYLLPLGEDGRVKWSWTRTGFGGFSSGCGRVDQRDVLAANPDVRVAGDGPGCRNSIGPGVSPLASP